MKELSITKDSYLIFRHCYIRAPRQIPVVFSIPIALLPQCLSQLHLNRCIFGVNIAHGFVALFLSQYVHLYPRPILRSLSGIALVFRFCWQETDAWEIYAPSLYSN